MRIIIIISDSMIILKSKKLWESWAGFAAEILTFSSFSNKGFCISNIWLSSMYIGFGGLNIFWNLFGFGEQEVWEGGLIDSLFFLNLNEKYEREFIELEFIELLKWISLSF